MNTVVADGYFTLMKMPIVDGVGFGARAPEGAAIVNETLARQLWPGRSAVGQTLEARDRGSHLSTVVGVVRDSRYESLREASSAFVYTRAADDYDSTQVVFARATGDAGMLVPLLRRAVREVDPRVPILTASTLVDHVASTLAQPRAAAELVTISAVMAGLLAAAGLHGVLVFVAASRRREMAIRNALGARPGQIALALGGRSMLTVCAGAAIGTAGALALQRSLAGFLYGVTPAQPSVLALAAVVTLCLALLACAGPALRAIRTPPASALRDS
jgi:hypothetical protein